MLNTPIYVLAPLSSEGIKFKTNDVKKRAEKDTKTVFFVVVVIFYSRTLSLLHFFFDNSQMKHKCDLGIGYNVTLCHKFLETTVKVGQLS